MVLAEKTRVEGHCIMAGEAVEEAQALALGLHSPEVEWRTDKAMECIAREATDGSGM